jgi:hypothetical protein
VLVNLEPTTSTGTGRSRRTATRSCGSSRTRPARTPRRPPGFEIPGGPRAVEFTADDPLPAEPGSRAPQPRERRRRDRGRARGRAPDDAIAEALRTFPGVPHRLELVAELGGVRFVNDSKATNTAAARRALASYASRCT